MYAILGIMSFRREFINCVLCYNLARDGPFEPLRVRLFKRALMLTTVAWPFVAGYLRIQVKECDKYILEAVNVILVYYIVILIVLVIETCGLSIALMLIR